MTHPISRRSFGRSALLGSVAGSALLSIGGRLLSALEPFAHTKTPRLRLGLAAYSFRDHFTPGEKNPPLSTPDAKPLDMFGFVDYCAEHGCDGAELTSYYFPKDISPDYLMRLKRHAFLRGVEISGTAVGNTFTHSAGAERTKEVAAVRLWIDRAAALGAPHIRIFAGSVPKGLSAAEAKKNCIETTREVAAYAGEKGIFLGIENHGGIVAEADQLLDIVRSVDSPWVGINLDIGNFNTQDPYADLERCAPYAVNVQFKTDIHPKGQKPHTTDLPRVVKMLQQAKYQGYFTLEYESSQDPWSGVPQWLQKMRSSL